ncbi:Zinc finger CCCH domain-containing protein 30 [Morella rubra]|uniref:Zinc finger CCCH domain-containing protein 30 n=1 Tax=Morella rubra TaxID=262757 RepID=A0A6A1WHD7_9ROSI|nr:Zinc finger CCCH domain-containing protein 30 [Morella rubra]
MCSGPERSKSPSTPTASTAETTTNTKNMNNLTVQTEDSFSSLLDLAANNDVEGFKRSLVMDASSIDEAGLWYVRQKGSKQIVLEHRTPLMVAATYGSVDVLKFILSHSEVDVNFSCGQDKTTALHCAASGGSLNAVDVVKLLLFVGADPNRTDANGLRPINVIVVVRPKSQSMREALEELLSNNASDVSGDERLLQVSISTSGSDSPTLSSSPENGLVSSSSEFVSSPVASKLNDMTVSSISEKKEYPVDPSLPDIKNSIYATDEFRMFSFKVRPCSRAYSHDWTECPFVHPGENARRRDPRKYHYSCVPCPDFRKGACRRGDMCEYAHGVFECWLHPAQYRTRLCKDGTSCNRRVCFFAHTADELRPLYVSTGSAVPSPRSSASAHSVMDMAAAMSLLPGSPSSISAMSPSPFAQPMSPSANSSVSHSSAAWPQPNSWSNTVYPNRSGRSKTLTPSNLEELFLSEISSSPRYSDTAAAAVFSPTHKSAVLNQFQQQQGMLSPINTNVFSPKNEHPLFQASFGIQSPGRMSPRSLEPISPMGSRLPTFAQREKQHQQLRSLSSRDLGANNPASIVGSPVNSWAKWGSPNGRGDVLVNGGEVGHLRRSSSFELANNGEEPDLSWVQSLVKESPTEMMKEKLAIPVSGPPASGGGLSSSSQNDSIDHSVLGAWLEQMQLDQLVA